MRWESILAIATKEWRLNVRFPMEYIIANIGNPIKTAIFMMFLYSGLLGGTTLSIGKVNGQTYQIYVLIGTTCQTLLMYSASVFRQRMVVEKWWQTATATFISPVGMHEVMLGYLLGGCSIQLVMSTLVIGFLQFFYHVPMANLVPSFLMLVAIMLFGFGFGVLGATISLCWEGASWLFDYGLQVITYASCFYYPLEIFPKILRPMVKIIPTYQMGAALHEYMSPGSVLDYNVIWISYFCVLGFFLVALPALFFNYSIKKFGITGY